MKLLFFTYDFPYPLNTGGKNRAFNLIKHSSSDIEIHLFSFVRGKISQGNKNELFKIGVKNIELFDRPFANINAIFSSPLKNFHRLPEVLKLIDPFTAITQKLYLHQAIEERLVEYIQKEKINVVHFESLYTAYYINQKIKQLGVKQIFGTENIEHLLYKEYIRHSVPVILKPLYYIEYEKIKQNELRLLRKADDIIAVTKTESEYFKTVSGKQCEIIPNGVDLSRFSFHFRERTPKVLLFVGNFSYFPNIDAIENFYTSVFVPLNNPDLKLRIIGKNAKSLSFEQNKNVETIEFVEDIVSEYQKGDIFIFPLRIGGGTNFKILEAMACGIPVVAFSDRVKELGIHHNKETLIANNAGEFCDHINKLLTDAQKRKTLSLNARTFVEENYSWKIIGKKLNTFWKKYNEKN